MRGNTETRLRRIERLLTGEGSDIVTIRYRDGMEMRRPLCDVIPELQGGNIVSVTGKVGSDNGLLMDLINGILKEEN